ncbi:hypothetical protein BDR04DRAFT_1118775 [Suillus decipiens]|nr:hypothetical protein BDR04DRAFT_1118775 [Suillus decipiens]
MDDPLALNREDKAPVSNFIKINDGGRRNAPSVLGTKRKCKSAYIKEIFSLEEQGSDMETSDSKQEETYLQNKSLGDECDVFPIERMTRNSTQGRQERYNKVFHHKQDNILKKAKRERETKSIPIPKPKSDHPSVKESKRPQEKGWESEDIVMDDEDDGGKNKRNGKDNEHTYKQNSNSNQKYTMHQHVSDLFAKIKLEKRSRWENFLEVPMTCVAY